MRESLQPSQSKPILRADMAMFLTLTADCTVLTIWCGACMPSAQHLAQASETPRLEDILACSVVQQFLCITLQHIDIPRKLVMSVQADLGIHVHTGYASCYGIYYAMVTQPTADAATGSRHPNLDGATGGVDAPFGCCLVGCSWQLPSMLLSQTLSRCISSA